MIDKVKLKETDLILTLLADTGRQIRAVAKGARKPGARTAARCELFCTVDLLLAHGRNLDVVSQAELVDAPLGAEATYERLCAASAVAEQNVKIMHCSTNNPNLRLVLVKKLFGLDIGDSRDLPNLQLIELSFTVESTSLFGLVFDW